MVCRSDTIQRRFTIAKSLLAKADKSSFDRLCGQVLFYHSKLICPTVSSCALILHLRILAA